MLVQLLIDDIVRQTTLLIAQLSTAAGLRAPLARIADQVFLELGRELEAQGVAQKVAADMFGLALRSYQLKLKRLGESADTAHVSLWQDIHDRLSTASASAASSSACSRAAMRRTSRRCCTTWSRVGSLTLWRQVAAHNEAHPPPEASDRVTFYFGQMVIEAAEQEQGS
jgi:hypothetical protein